MIVDLSPWLKYQLRQAKSLTLMQGTQRPRDRSKRFPKNSWEKSEITEHFKRLKGASDQVSLHRVAKKTFHTEAEHVDFEVDVDGMRHEDSLDGLRKGRNLCASNIIQIAHLVESCIVSQSLLSSLPAYSQDRWILCLEWLSGTALLCHLGNLGELKGARLMSGKEPDLIPQFPGKVGETRKLRKRLRDRQLR